VIDESMNIKDEVQTNPPNYSFEGTSEVHIHI